MIPLYQQCPLDFADPLMGGDGMGARNLPVAVVGEFIVTGEGNEHPKPNAQ